MVYDPAIPIWNLYPKTLNTRNKTDTYTTTFIVVLLIRVIIWNQPRCLLSEKWTKKPPPHTHQNISQLLKKQLSFVYVGWYGWWTELDSVLAATCNSKDWGHRRWSFLRESPNGSLDSKLQSQRGAQNLCFTLESMFWDWAYSTSEACAETNVYVSITLQKCYFTHLPSQWLRLSYYTISLNDLWLHCNLCMIICSRWHLQVKW